MAWVRRTGPRFSNCGYSPSWQLQRCQRAKRTYQQDPVHCPQWGWSDSHSDHSAFAKAEAGGRFWGASESPYRIHACFYLPNSAYIFLALKQIQETLVGKYAAIHFSCGPTVSEEKDADMPWKVPQVFFGITCEISDPGSLIICWDNLRLHPGSLTAGTYKLPI